MKMCCRRVVHPSCRTRPGTGVKDGASTEAAAAEGLPYIVRLEHKGNKIARPMGQTKLTRLSKAVEKCILSPFSARSALSFHPKHQSTKAPKHQSTKGVSATHGPTLHSHDCREN